jgi:hypothetical protein
VEVDTATSFLRSSSAQCIERKHDLASLTPKDGFVSAKWVCLPPRREGRGPKLRYPPSSTTLLRHPAGEFCDDAADKPARELIAHFASKRWGLLGAISQFE